MANIEEGGLSEAGLDSKKESAEVEVQAYGTKAPITSLLIIGVILAVMQSLNFGLGIGMVNLAANAVQVDLGLGVWALGSCDNSPWTTTQADGSPVEQGTEDSIFCQEDGDMDTWSWIVAAFALGGMVGGLGGAPIAAKIGPKKTMLGNNVLFFGASLLQAFASNATLMIVGRVICGVAVGILCNAAPVWVSECSPDHARGAFGVFHQLFITIGILLATFLGMEAALGTESGWPFLYASFIVPAAINACGFFFMPDSPRFLVSVGDGEGAKQSLRRLRGPTYSIDYEYDQLNEAQKKEEEAGILSMMAALKAIFTRYYYRQTLIAVGVQICQQMSGINAIMFYSASIFISSGFEDVEVATILVNTVNVLATVAAVPLIERMGRRGLLLFGFGGMIIMHALFGTGMVLGWEIPTIIFMLLGVICFAVGPGPIPWMITAEIFPASVRNGAVGVAVFTNWLMTFAVGKFFPPLQEAMEDYTFFFFCGWCVAIFVFVWFLIPETKGKSLPECLALFGQGPLAQPK